MNSKTNSCSLWYGFIFNLLVALCTIGFMCYFFHRFDSRLVSLERRVWEKQRGGKLDTSWNTGYFYQANSNGEAVLRRKARKGGKLKHLNTELGKILNKKERGSWSETGELWYWKRLSLKHMKGHWFYLTPYQGVCLFTCLPTDYVTLSRRETCVQESNACHARGLVWNTRETYSLCFRSSTSTRYRLLFKSSSFLLFFFFFTKTWHVKRFCKVKICVEIIRLSRPVPWTCLKLAHDSRHKP